MTRNPNKGKRCRRVVADPVEDHDDFIFQRRKSRSKVFGRSVSAGVSESPKSPDRSICDLGESNHESGHEHTRAKCHSNCDAEAGMRQRVYSDVKPRRVVSYCCPRPTAAYQSVWEKTAVEQSDMGEELSSVSECSLPVDRLSRLTSQDAASVRLNKENPKTVLACKSIIQDKKWYLINHRSIRVEDVDLLFTEEETVGNLRQRLAISEAVIEYMSFLCAALSYKGPLIEGPFYKTIMAKRNNHLSFRDVYQSLVGSHVTSGPSPGTDEHSFITTQSVGSHHPHDKKKDRNLQDDNSSKSINNTPLGLRDANSNNGLKEEPQDGERLQANAELDPETDWNYTPSSSSMSNTEEEQYATRIYEQELFNDICDTMENDTRRSERSSIRYDARCLSSRRIGLGDHAHEEIFRQRGTHGYTWQNSPHSRNHVSSRPSLTFQKKRRAKAAEKETYNLNDSPANLIGALESRQQALSMGSFPAAERRTSEYESYRIKERHGSPSRPYRSIYRHGSPSRPYISTYRQSPSEPYRNTNRHGSPNGFYKGTKRHISPNGLYGVTKRRNIHHLPKRGIQRQISPNRNFRRTNRNTSPNRLFRAPQRYISPIRSFWETALPLQISPQIDNPKPESIELDPLESRVSIGFSHLSYHDKLKGSERCMNSTTSDASFAPATRSATERVTVESIVQNCSMPDENCERRRTLESHKISVADLMLINTDSHVAEPRECMSTRKKVTGNVGSYTCGLPLRQDKCHFKGETEVESRRCVSSEANLTPIIAPVKASFNAEPANGGQIGSVIKDCMEQAIKQGEGLFNRAHRSYRRPQPIEFPDKETGVMKRRTPAISLSVHTGAMKKHNLSSSVSVYWKIPHHILERCAPGDPRRQYLDAVDNSEDKCVSSCSMLKTPFSEETEKALAPVCSMVENAQGKSVFNECRTEFIQNEGNACSDMDYNLIPCVTYPKKVSVYAKYTPRRRLVSGRERWRRRKLCGNYTLNKSHVLRLLDDICTRRDPVLPLSEDEEKCANSKVPPKHSDSMVGDACTSQTQIGFHHNGGEVHSKLCSAACESEEQPLETLRTFPSLKNLCFSVLSQFPTGQTDTRSSLKNLIVSDLLRVQIFLKNHRLNSTSSYGETFLSDEGSRRAVLPRKFTSLIKMLLGDRLSTGGGSLMDINNSNESEDELDTENCHHTRRPPEVCEKVFFDAMSTPIVLSAADRVYHVNKCNNGWSTAKYHSKFNNISKDAVTPDFSLGECLSSETMTKLPNDCSVKQYFHQPDFLDLVDEEQGSYLFETAEHIQNSEDILVQAMWCAGLANYVVGDFLKCDPSMEPHLLEQAAHPSDDEFCSLNDLSNLDFQGGICDRNVANSNEEKSECFDFTDNYTTQMNDIREHSYLTQPLSQQAIYWPTNYFTGCYNEHANESYSKFESALDGTLDHVNHELPRRTSARLESVGAMPASWSHNEHDELASLDHYCNTQSQYYVPHTGEFKNPDEVSFLEDIPEYASLRPPHCEERCSITHNSLQLNQALDLLSEDELCYLDEDIQGNLNIDNGKALHQTPDEVMTRTRVNSSSYTPSGSLEGTTTTACPSPKTILRQRQSTRARCFKAAAAFTTYEAVETPQATSCREKKEGGTARSAFIARTLDCVNSYGLRNREMKKMTCKRDLKSRASSDTDFKVDFKTLKQKRTKGSVGLRRLYPECIAESDLNFPTDSFCVNSHKGSVRVTRSNHRDAEVHCVQHDFLAETPIQETLNGNIQDVLVPAQINQESGKIPNSSQMNCKPFDTNTRENVVNVSCQVPTAGVIEGVSRNTLTSYFDRQLQSTDLFKQQMSKLSPGFLKKSTDKGLQTQPQSRINRISTNIVYLMKSSKWKMSAGEKKLTAEASQLWPEDVLDYNNNASWDNIDPGSSKVKVAKTEKSKDPKRIQSNETRLHLPRVFDKGLSLEKEKKKLDKISDKFRKQYQSLHQAPSTLSLLPISGVTANLNSGRGHVLSKEIGQLPEIGLTRSGNENQNKSPMCGACTLPAMKTSVQENSKVLNFVKRLDSRYGDQLAHGDVDTSKRLKKCCKSYLTKHSGNKSTGAVSVEKRMKDCHVNCTPCKTSEKIDQDINFLAAHNSNLIDSSAAFSSATGETRPAETADSLPQDTSTPASKPITEGNASCSGQASAKTAKAPSARKLTKSKARPSARKTPLRSDIASSVNRLAAKPFSPTTRLMYKIQSYEHEFKKPFNINESTPTKLATVATSKFSKEKYARDIQRLLPVAGCSSEDATPGLEASKSKRSFSSVARDSLQGRNASNITKKPLGGLPKRFDEFPDGAIKDDQLETRQTIMASLPSELKLDNEKEHRKEHQKRVRAIDALKTPNRFSPLKSIDVNEHQSECKHLEIKSLAQLKQVSEQSFSLEFPNIFDQGHRSAPLSNSIVAAGGAFNTGSLKHPESASSDKCDSTLTDGQQDVKQRLAGVSPSTSKTQKGFYSISRPARISEELLKELETIPESMSGSEEVKSLEEELEEFLNECGDDDKALSDYYMHDFDVIDVDEDEIKQLVNRSGSDQLVNRSGSDQLVDMSGSDQLENSSPKGPTPASVSGESVLSTSPRICSQSHKAKVAENIDPGGGGDCTAPDSPDPRPGSGADSSCDIFKVESLTSIKRSIDCAFDDQFNDVSDTYASGKKEDSFWGHATDYWTDSNTYVPEQRSFKKLTPIQEDLEEEDASITSEDQ